MHHPQRRPELGAGSAHHRRMRRFSRIADFLEAVGGIANRPEILAQGFTPDLIRFAVQFGSIQPVPCILLHPIVAGTAPERYPVSCEMRGATAGRLPVSAPSPSGDSSKRFRATPCTYAAAPVATDCDTRTRRSSTGPTRPCAAALGSPFLRTPPRGRRLSAPLRHHEPTTSPCSLSTSTPFSGKSPERAPAPAPQSREMRIISSRGTTLTRSRP